MSKSVIDQMENLRQTNAIKTMYYTRYFLVRYVITFYFFINLYWALTLYLSHALIAMMLPVFLGVIGIAAMWEQFRMFTTKQAEAKISKLFFRLAVAVNSCLIFATLVGKSSFFYPFFNNSFDSKMFILSMLGFGIVLAIWMLHKINQIDGNKDRQFVRINRYIASLKPSKHY